MLSKRLVSMTRHIEPKPFSFALLVNSLTRKQTGCSEGRTNNNGTAAGTISVLKKGPAAGTIYLSLTELEVINRTHGGHFSERPFLIRMEFQYLITALAVLSNALCLVQSEYTLKTDNWFVRWLTLL